MAHQKPFVYVPRPLFVEEAGLLSQLMVPYGRSIQLPRDAFQKGSWASFITRADELPPPTRTIDTNGHLGVCNALENIYLETKN